MKSFLEILLGMLSALIASSLSLNCIQCSSSTSTSCTGASVSCSSGSLCAVLYQVFTVDNSSLASYTMTCLPQTQCNVNGSISITKENIKMASSCCSTDNCVPGLPSLPGDSSVPNGVKCKSCISTDSNWCYTLATIKCRGSETMCVLQSTTQTGSKPQSMAIRGCATKSICDLRSQAYNVNGQLTNNTYFCTSGGNSLSLGILVVVCSLLIKILF